MCTLADLIHRVNQGEEAADFFTLVWPPERVVCGLRVSKTLRALLQGIPTRMLMRSRLCTHVIGGTGTHEPKSQIARALAPLPLCDLDLEIGPRNRGHGCGSLMSQALRELGLALKANTWGGSLRRLALSRPDALSYLDVADVLLHCTRLELLDLSGGYFCERQGVTELIGTLPRLTCLTHLTLRSLSIHGARAKLLGGMLPNFTELRVLDLSGNCLFPDIAHFSTLARLPALEYLDLSPKHTYANMEEDSDYDGLALPPTLTHLDLSSHPFPAAWFARVIPTLTRLQRLDVAQTRPSSLVCTALAQCSTLLTQLRVGGCVDERCGVAFGHALLHLHALRSLDLSRSQLFDTGLQLHSCRALSALSTLNLSACGLGPVAAQQLFAVLARGDARALAQLRIDENACFEAGGQGVERALAQCRGLTTLGLRRAALTDIAATALARGLRCCSALTALDMGANHVSGAGAWEVGRAVQHCAELCSLDLQGCQGLGDEGVKQLLLSLSPGGCVCALDVRDTGMRSLCPDLDFPPRIRPLLGSAWA